MKFSVRDLLWLTVVVALAVACWLQYRETAHLREEVRIWQGGFDILREDLARIIGAPADKISVLDSIYSDKAIGEPNPLAPVPNQPTQNLDRPLSIEEQLAVLRKRQGTRADADVIIGWPIDANEIQGRRRRYEEYERENLKKATPRN